jgi:DNA repair exonuclease SbcCD ATPase subunit
MQIISLSAENVKRLVAVHIEPKGPVVQITGKNASGKTSVLDSIMWALGGKETMDADPIRHGAASARIKLDMGELVVTRVITASGSELRVEAANGTRVSSPQKVLDGLLGALTFDPLEFTRLKARQQFDRLREIVPLDIDLDAMDAANKRDAEERTEVNRHIKSLKSHLEGFPEFPEDLPAEKVSAASISEEIRKAHEHNQEVARLEDMHARRDRKMADLKDEIAKLEAKLAEAKAELAKVEAYSLDDIPFKIDVQPLVERMNNIEKVNGLIAKRSEAQLMAESLAQFEQQYAELGRAIASREEEKKEAMAKAKMPVPGLGFGDGVVTFNDVPLEQSSTAEQLRVSVAIAMAANPKLRVLRIMEGSLLDEDSLAMIAQMAAAQDYQVWVEQVDSTGKVGVVISEGKVVADHQGVVPTSDQATEVRTVGAAAPDKEPAVGGEIPF